METIEVTDHELDEERLAAFRRAAETRGGEAVVQWRGRPHLVTERRAEDGTETFVLEPIPRPFG